MSRLIAYLHPKCSTCQEARQWLQSRGLKFEEKDIRETPPTISELRTMMAAYGGERRKLFNTSGIDYRALGIAAKLPGLDDAGALALLTGNGMLVKRPFLIGPGVAVVGFKEEVWEKVLGWSEH